MPIAPLDLQVLYMQQSHIGRMEHVRMAAKTIAMQSEDKDIHRDSYIKDSTVVKSENVAEDNKIKEKKVKIIKLKKKKIIKKIKVICHIEKKIKRNLYLIKIMMIVKIII